MCTEGVSNSGGSLMAVNEVDVVVLDMGKPRDYKDRLHCDTLFPACVDIQIT